MLSTGFVDALGKPAAARCLPVAEVIYLHPKEHETTGLFLQSQHPWWKKATVHGCRSDRLTGLRLEVEGFAALQAVQADIIAHHFGFDWQFLALDLQRDTSDGTQRTDITHHTGTVLRIGLT